MGKTPKPLIIAVHPAIAGWEELAKLADQGHTVMPLGADIGADLVLGPTSWLMTEKHRKYLDLAIKTARGTRHSRVPKPKKEGTK